MIALNKRINDEEIDLSEELFKKYFKIQRPIDMLMYLNKTNDKKKNNELVNVINRGLKDLKIFLKKKKKLKTQNCYDYCYDYDYDYYYSHYKNGDNFYEY